MSRLRHTFLAAARAIDLLERALLTLLVTGMVLLAAAQILMRNLWHSGWPWVEPLLGMALLWLTMLGALAATGQGRHIAMDLAAALLPRAGARALARPVSLASAVLCAMLAIAAMRYVSFQREMDIGQLLGAPIWKFYLIIPVSFWLMALRFTLRALLPGAWISPPPSAIETPVEAP